MCGIEKIHKGCKVILKMDWYKLSIDQLSQLIKPYTTLQYKTFAAILEVTQKLSRDNQIKVPPDMMLILNQPNLQDQVVPLMTLPKELLEKICEYLDHSDIVNFLSINKKFTHDDFWSVIIKQRFGMTCLPKNNPSVKKIYMWYNNQNIIDHGILSISTKYEPTADFSSVNYESPVNFTKFVPTNIDEIMITEMQKGGMTVTYEDLRELARSVPSEIRNTVMPFLKVPYSELQRVIFLAGLVNQDAFLREVIRRRDERASTEHLLSELSSSI